MTTISKTESASLEDRVKKLAADKSNLQLIVGLMSRVGTAAGLDNVAEAVLRGLGDLLGGVNVKLYYRFNDELWCADLIEGRQKIESVDDDAVKRVTETREFVEIEHLLSDAQVKVPEFTKAYTWAVPLLVGSELVGVLRMESVRVTLRDLLRDLPTFFTFTALVLKNQISGHSRPQKAYTGLECKVDCDERPRDIALERDITERKRVEEMLRKQARLNQALFNQAISCFVIFDRNWKFIQVNEAYAKHYKKNPADLVGRTYPEVFPPPDMALFAAVTRELVDLKKPVVLTESLYIFPDQPERGETYWDIILQPLLNDQGEVEFIFFSSIDVTERKRAQERVRDLAAIVGSTDDAVIGKTLEEKIVSWNRGAEQIYGYTAAEMIGQSLSLLVPANRRKELKDIMAKLKNGERIRHFETERLRKDGQLVSVALTISPIKDANGRIVGASTIARDITERKRMEDALLFVAQRGWKTGKESFLNALARFLCEKLDMDYAFVDKTDENRDMAETVALCAKGVIAPNLRYALKGTPCENVMGRKLCVYRQGIQQLFPEDALLAQMGAESYIGIPLWDSSGQPIGLIAVMGSKPIPDAASVTQLLQLVATRAAAELERNRAEEALVKLNAELEQRVKDRTAELQREMDSRFRQQQFLEAVLESIDAGIVACDADGILTLFNRKTRELHGLPQTPIPAEQWAEHYDLYLPDGKTPMRKEDVPLFRALQGERVTNDEMMIIPRGGEPKVMLVNGQFILDKESRKIGAVVAMHDITERKRAEQAIQKLNAELRQRATALEAANNELESFSYSVSHDLRAPLRSIDGFSEALIEDCADKLDGEAKENLQSIRSATQRMGSLIDDMLRLSQLNRSEMRWTDVNLSQMAEEIAVGLKKSAPERSSEFIIAPDCFVHGDKSLLRIAMENILSNAWKYTGRKQHATIEFGFTTGAEGRVFFVRDNGCGFDMRYVNKLFGAFSRLHDAAEFAGTGIGLSSVRRVIERHGGRVWIEGEVDRGATLYFTMPEHK